MIQYDPHNWLDHFFDIRGSLVKEILGRVLLCTAWSGFIVYVHSNHYSLGIPAIAHTLIGTALGLLLVFRTNASYDRFWEGRKLWGGVVNETRNLIRTTEAFLFSAPEVRREIGLWTVAFVHAMMNALRDKKSFGPIASELPQEKVKRGEESRHLALFAAREISFILQTARNEGKLTDITQVNIDQNVQLLVDYLGGCERIHKTPLPFAYVVHLRRALIVYCFTLPFALVEVFKSPWLTILATLFFAYVFFGIEEIGVEIEDPFGEDENDLPLETICESIERNTEGLLTVQLKRR